MTLAALLAEVEVAAVSGPTDAEVTGVSYDSRRVRPGSVFFGLAGQREDGARYAEQALAAGAVAVVVARGMAVRARTVIEVEEPRRALAQAAARFHDHPEQRLAVVGVTGTNGKTTTTWMLESIFRAAGWRAGVIGTTGVMLGDERRPAALTTPESPELFGLLAEMVARDVRSVAIEVSSHALVQRRTYGLGCRAAVFTNLSRDHLDYHGTMERYLDAKLMLFDGRNGPVGREAVAVVNADDPAAGAVEVAARKGGLRVLRFAVEGGGTPLPSGTLDLLVEGLEVTGRGLALRISPAGLFRGASSGFRVDVPLLGAHNAWNAAAAVTTGLALGLGRDVVARGIEAVPQVPGRLERVEEGQPFLVVVDYAHTPDALERALAAAREHGGGRVLLVFGAGGDRDRGKRAPMGAVAARLADRAWITNDNPRSEDPQAIAEAIRGPAPAGAPATGRTRLTIELDRRAAIAAALAEARPGDTVVIAGKGHETTQTIGTTVLPFDDREVAREELRSLAARAGGGHS